jgi:hypothetical protein
MQRLGDHRAELGNIAAVRFSGGDASAMKPERDKPVIGGGLVGDGWRARGCNDNLTVHWCSFPSAKECFLSCTHHKLGLAQFGRRVDAISYRIQYRIRAAIGP